MGNHTSRKGWFDLTESEKEDQRKRNRDHYHRYPEKMRARRIASQKSNREYVDSFKTQCERCGYSDKRALQFHHATGTKEKAVATLAIAGYSKKRIAAEISKCIVLCANCHQIEHMESGYHREDGPTRH